MAERQDSSNVIKAISDLLKSDLERPKGEQSGLEPGMALLRSWQVERLAKTYADLLVDRHYGPACRFFLSDIYAPRDFSQRDQDIEHIHSWLSRFLPASMIRLVTDTILLNRLTSELDRRLLQVLVGELKITDTIPAGVYAEAYRRCDNYAVRVQQIDLMVKILREVGEGARMPLVGLTIKLTRKPARQAGWSDFHETLARGHDAFQQMHRVRKFVSTIEHREKRILERIYAGNLNPFDLNT
jgi:hypothetical protein